MSSHNLVLTGKYVRLEPIDESHVDGLAAIGLDPSLWEVALERVTSREEMAVYVAKAQGPAFLAFAVRRLDTGAVAGSTRFMNIEPAHKRLEIGSTWYGVAFQRTVVNTECKLLLMTHAFETMGMNRVELKTDLLNIRSQRAMERLGCQREGILRRHMITASGRVRDTVYYSVIAEEWPSVKERLTAAHDRMVEPR